MNTDDTINQSPDPNPFPTLDLPAELHADDGTEEVSDGPTKNLRWDFCLLFAGSAWVTLPVYAPSPEAAASTMEAFVQQVNTTLLRMGYPPNCCTWTTGPCS